MPFAVVRTYRSSTCRNVRTTICVLITLLNDVQYYNAVVTSDKFSSVSSVLRNITHARTAGCWVNPREGDLICAILIRSVGLVSKSKCIARNRVELKYQNFLGRTSDSVDETVKG